jgi:serine/threonine-protein kinase HipA
MNNCRITLKTLPKRTKYEGFSDVGVRRLFGTLKVSPMVNFDRQDLESYPASHNGKMSISGFQPKMSATVIDDELVLVKENGTFIIKPSPAQFPNLAENEHAIMTIASTCKFQVPPFGLIQLSNGELAFIIQRYDRESGTKLHQEQLDSAMGINDKFGNINGFQTISYSKAGAFIAQNLKAVQQYADFYRRVIFSYVVGNNDHHLRNFSLLYSNRGAIPTLSPVYDVVSVQPYSEYFRGSYMALPLLKTEEHESVLDIETGFDRKYGQYDRQDFIKLGEEIGLKKQAAVKLLDDLLKSIEKAVSTVSGSFMNESHKQGIEQLIRHRIMILKDESTVL